MPVCVLCLRDLWYLWYLRDPWYLRMFACLQWSHGSRVCVLVSLVSLHMHVCNEMIGRVFACLSNFSIVSLVASRVVCLPRLLRLPSLVAWSRASLYYIYWVGTLRVPCDLSSLCLFVIHRSTGGSHRYES